MIKTDFKKFDYSEKFNKVHWNKYARERGIPSDDTLVLDFLEYPHWTPQITEQFKEPLLYMLRKGFEESNLEVGTLLRVFYEKMVKTEENIKFVTDNIQSYLHDKERMKFFNYQHANKIYGLDIEDNKALWLVLNKVTLYKPLCSHFYLMSAEENELKAAVSNKEHFLSVLIEDLYIPENASTIINGEYVMVDYYTLMCKLIQYLDEIENTYIKPPQKLGFYLTQLKLNEQSKLYVKIDQKLQIQNTSKNISKKTTYAETETYLTTKLISEYPKEYEAYKLLQSIDPDMPFEMVLSTLENNVDDVQISEITFQ